MLTNGRTGAADAEDDEVEATCPCCEGGHCPSATAGRHRSRVVDGDSVNAAAPGILDQEEIDSLLQLTDAGRAAQKAGLAALIDNSTVSYERLPMLEVVFDRLVRMMTTSLRNFTSENVEVKIDQIDSLRFNDYLNTVSLPALIAVFRVEQWDNFGLVTVARGAARDGADAG